MQIGPPVALVADDHELFRAGFSVLLRKHCGFGEIVEAESLDQAVQALGERGDVTFACFDLAMPGVDSALSLLAVREVFPRVRVVVVSASNRREDIIMALTAGVHGYVPKNFSPQETAQALNWIVQGRIFLPPCVAEISAQSHLLKVMLPGGTAASSATRETTPRLTPRQNEVLQLLREGKSNKEIARILDLTENTIKVHAAALYRALGVHSRVSAAASGHAS